ncbi:MAG: ABC transporter permease [Acidimicrobiia bacterium]
MTGYILRRVASLLPLAVALSAFSFFLGQIAPGDPARALLSLQGGTPPTAEQVETFRAELGLDDPALVQYGRWARGALTGDLGRSFRTGQPVAGRLSQALPVTVSLALLSFVVVTVVGVSAGIGASLVEGRLADHALRVVSLAGASLPSFFVGYLLVLALAVRLGAFPTSGVSSASAYVLPAVTLALPSTAVVMRLTRAAMLDALADDSVRAARARGVPQRRIVLRHALRVALNPIATYGGVALAGLLGGAVIVETVFAMPGLGKLVVDAIVDRDFPVVQGFVLLFGALVLVVNLVVDLLYGVLDPRVRVAAQHDGGAGGR